MNHSQCRDRFAGALYGELSTNDERSFNEHINSCESCAKEFAELTAVAGVMNRRVRPQPTPQEWNAFWNRLSAAIDAEAIEPEHVRRWDWLTVLAARPSVRLSFAGVAILLLGMLIGRMAWEPAVTDDPKPAEEIPSAERVALEHETMEYLDRSKVLLLGIINAGPTRGDDVRLLQPQERSRRLVTEGSALKARLNDADYRQLSALVEDLEVLLLQIANLQAENNFPGLEIIRDGVKRKGILLKINLEQMRSASPRELPRTEPAHTQQRSSI